MGRTSNWKNVERKIADLLNGQRVPITGRTRGSAPDIEHDEFSIEVKHRKLFPSWLMDAFDQAIKSRKENQIPIVILHQERQKYEDSLIIIRVGDIIGENEDK